MASFPITPGGLRKLKDELARLKKIERPKISQEIGVARELGDLSENFEYHAAKDKQGMIEARIRVLEDQITRAEVIDPEKLSGDRVVFGAKVRLEDVDADDVRIYQIVGESESNIDAGRISIASPLARALIGREVGDEVLIRGKAGKPRTVEITDVTFEKVPT